MVDERTRNLTETTAEEGEHEPQVVDQSLWDGKLQREGQQTEKAMFDMGRKLGWLFLDLFSVRLVKGLPS